MRIGFTYDLKADYLALGFSEHAVAEFDTEVTIDAISGALASLGHDVVRIGHVKALASRLVAGERWDLVFNIAEGVAGFGRESQVPALLEAYAIPYTFSDPLVCALTLHKGMAKHVARGYGVPTPDFALVTVPADAAADHAAVPAVREAGRRGHEQRRDRALAREVAHGAARRLCRAARGVSRARASRGVRERPRVHGRNPGHRR